VFPSMTKGEIVGRLVVVIDVNSSHGFWIYWCNSYTIVHCSLDIIEWFKYKLKKVFKLYLILIHLPSQYQQLVS
jgi:hypothetical protein